MRWTRSFTIFATAVGLFMLVNQARAASDITRSAPTTISGDSDVSTTGTLVAAYNVGDPTVTSTTINGVTFTAFPITDGGALTSSGSLQVMGFSNEPMNTAASLGSASAPFSGLSANYRSMLGTGVTKSSNSIHFLDMDLLNLTVGQTYTLQVWTNNSNAITTTASLWDNSGNDVQPLDINTTDANGGVGQYAFGTFTANATDQPFFIHGDPFPTGVAVLNGLQLRTAGSIPEPSTIGLLLLAAIGRLLARRNR